MTEIITLDSVDSTNTYLARNCAGMPAGTVVCALSQTAGRGQRGNSWESAPGANITMSLLLRPAGLLPARQFIISQAVSLAIVETLDPLVGDHTVSIKWPNDIYVDDSKICGILIENAVSASSGIERSIVGIGVNVNQRRFVSDAPNPVSLLQLTSCEHELMPIVRSITGRITGLLDEALSGEESAARIAARYFSRLWRRDGWHPYTDNLRHVDMEARIESVAPTGHITLVDRGDMTRRTYAFKEITFLLQ